MKKRQQYIALFCLLALLAGPFGVSTAYGQEEESKIEVISQMGKLQLRTIKLILDELEFEIDSDTRRTSLLELVQQSDMLKKESPDFIDVWVWRATAALELDNWVIGHEAGRNLVSLGALNSHDEDLLNLMANLNRRLWLSDDIAAVELNELRRVELSEDDVDDLSKSLRKDIVEVLNQLSSGNAWDGFNNLKSIRLRLGANIFDSYSLSKRALALALPVAVAQDNYELVKAGIWAGGDIEGQQGGQTIIHWAIAHGNKKLVQLLLAAGADINTLDRNGHSIIVKPVWQGDVVLTDRLLKLGVSPNVQGKAAPIIQEAIQNKSIAIVGLLVRSGATLVNVGNNEQLSKIFYQGLVDEDEALVKLLVENGANARMDHLGRDMVYHAKKLKKQNKTAMQKRLYKYLKKQPRWTGEIHSANDNNIDHNIS